MKRRFVSCLLAVLVILLFSSLLVGCSAEGAADTERVTVSNTAEKAQTDNEKDDGEEENMIFINLEFDGAVTSSPSLAVGYLGKRLSGVPLNLKRDGYIFSGWYTAPDCGGYQITDALEFIEGREIVSREIYGVGNGKDERITLYAGWVPRVIEVKLILGKKSYVRKIENGQYLSESDLDGRVATAYSENPSGMPAYDKPITKSITLYVTSYKETHTGYVTSCMDNNGYDIRESGSEGNVALHKGWVMGDVSLYAKKNSTAETEYELYYNLTEDVHNLPRGKAEDEIRELWLSNDTYAERVVGTDIKNERIGYGAYYVEVIYKNGEKEKFSGVNLLAGSSKGDSIRLCSFSEMEKNPISEINVSLMYELAFNNNVSYWLGFTWVADFRCDYKILMQR